MPIFFIKSPVKEAFKGLDLDKGIYKYVLWWNESHFLNCDSKFIISILRLNDMARFRNFL